MKIKTGIDYFATEGNVPEYTITQLYEIFIGKRTIIVYKYEFLGNFLKHFGKLSEVINDNYYIASKIQTKGK